jgi:hypothetical protein
MRRIVPSSEEFAYRDWAVGFLRVAADHLQDMPRAQVPRVLRSMSDALDALSGHVTALGVAIPPAPNVPGGAHVARLILDRRR